MPDVVYSKATVFHDFDDRWRISLESDQDDETIELPKDVTGIRSAIRHARHLLAGRGIDLGELTPVSEEHDTWTAETVPIRD